MVGALEERAGWHKFIASWNEGPQESAGDSHSEQENDQYLKIVVTTQQQQVGEHDTDCGEQNQDNVGQNDHEDGQNGEKDHGTAGADEDGRGGHGFERGDNSTSGT